MWGKGRVQAKFEKEISKGIVRLDWENKMFNGGFWDKMNGASEYIQKEGEFMLLSVSEKLL
jgi:hypothetical protein